MSFSWLSASRHARAGIISKHKQVTSHKHMFKLPRSYRPIHNTHTHTQTHTQSALHQSCLRLGYIGMLRYDGHKHSRDSTSPALFWRSSVRQRLQTRESIAKPCLVPRTGEFNSLEMQKDYLKHQKMCIIKSGYQAAAQRRGFTKVCGPSGS